MAAKAKQIPRATGGVQGEFTGIVYPLAIGMIDGPNLLQLFSAGATYRYEGPFLLAQEADGLSKVQIPATNVAFIAENFFLIDRK
jgi:hypothetical protein